MDFLPITSSPTGTYELFPSPGNDSYTELLSPSAIASPTPLISPPIPDEIERPKTPSDSFRRRDRSITVIELDEDTCLNPDVVFVEASRDDPVTRRSRSITFFDSDEDPFPGSPTPTETERPGTPMPSNSPNPSPIASPTMRFSPPLKPTKLPLKSLSLDELFDRLIEQTPYLPYGSSVHPFVNPYYIDPPSTHFNTSLAITEKVVKAILNQLYSTPKTEELAIKVYTNLSRLSVKLTGSPLQSDIIDIQPKLTYALQTLPYGSAYHMLCMIASQAFSIAKVKETVAPSLEIRNYEEIQKLYRDPHFTMLQTEMNSFFNTFKEDWEAAQSVEIPLETLKKFYTTISTLYQLCQEQYLSLPRGLTTLRSELYRLTH